MVYFGKDHVLFFATHSDFPGNAFVVKYDRTGGTSSLVYSFADDAALQRWMDRLAEKRNRDDLFFMLDALLVHHVEWDFLIPAIKLYYMMNRPLHPQPTNPDTTHRIESDRNGNKAISHRRRAMRKAPAPVSRFPAMFAPERSER